MKSVDVVLASICVAGGIRSLIHHARRPFASSDVWDQLLYAAYLTGRVGMWFAFAGMFLILGFAGATDPTPDPVTGRFVGFQDASDYLWYVVVFAVLGAMQVLASWFLGHRGGPSSSEDDDGPIPRP